MLRKIAVLLLLTVSALPAVHAAPGLDDADQLPVQQEALLGIGESISHRTADLVSAATDLLGVPYRRGGASIKTGFDCSGLVRAIFQQAAGLILPRRAAEQAAATAHIGKDELQPGDLVFFNTRRRSYSHVGIYVGDGNFIHAPRTGSRVRLDDMNARYWLKRFNGARRVLTGEPASDGAKEPLNNLAWSYSEYSEAP
jgi:hypothetical protein